MSARTNESLPQRVGRRLGWAVRDRWPGRPVTRTVQGVEMTLPWSHRLPDYARTSPDYGQNLVRLAREIAMADGEPVPVLDIGANVGDSALQILAATEARVLCVEADDFYLRFLRTNLGSHEGAEIEAALLLPQEADVDLVPVRSGGTTHFVPGSSDATAPTVTVDDLRARHPNFDRLRLVKSDTDGYDVTLVPAVARAWAASRPVLFFEYDHVLTRQAGNDPLAVWDELAGLGYTTARVWNNGGQPLATWTLEQAREQAMVLDRPLSERDYHFWDVAVAHGDDAAGLTAIDRA